MNTWKPSKYSHGERAEATRGLWDKNREKMKALQAKQEMEARERNYAQHGNWTVLKEGDPSYAKAVEAAKEERKKRQQK